MKRYGVAELNFQAEPGGRYVFMIRGIPEVGSWAVHDGSTLDDPIIGEVSCEQESWHLFRDHRISYQVPGGAVNVRRFLISTDVEVEDLWKVLIHVLRVETSTEELLEALE